jgi:sulfur relay (sulfurtransferase) DsrF/TusC family protein
MEGLMIVVKSGPEDTDKVGEALRLAAAMLGFDEPATVAFIDDGLRCLQPNAFSDPTLQDYLQAVADLAGIHAVSRTEDSETDIDPALGATLVDMGDLVTMMKDNVAVASF